MAFKPAERHGALEEVFPDVFLAWSTYRAGVGIAFDRTMTVVRQGAELIVLGSARLGDAGEAALARLGKVSHVVRVAHFHGVDDPYYADRFGATVWGYGGRALAADSHPFAAATVFKFAGANAGIDEYAVVLPVDGGVLVTGDSVQNWASYDNCSWLARKLMPRLGFSGAIIGGKAWVRRVGRGVRADFTQLAELPFRHLIPGHGSLLRDSARDALATALARFDASA